jgi:hypothetical protein
MSILGDRLGLAARVTRAKNNSLVVTCSDAGGSEAAVGRQKGGAAVLFGFKNGGKAAYTVEGGGTRLEVAVAGTTKVSRDGTVLGSIVGEGTSARIESAGGSALATIGPFDGNRNDPAWPHPLSSPDGSPIGTLTLMRLATGWSFDKLLMWTVTWDMAGMPAKMPSAGALLQLDGPVPEILGDLLVAALVDVSTLPRGYVA